MWNFKVSDFASASLSTLPRFTISFLHERCYANYHPSCFKRRHTYLLGTDTRPRETIHKKKKNQSLPSKLDFAISTSANEPRKKRTRVNEIRWFIEEPVLEWNERNGARQDWKERRKIDPPLVSSATDACKYIPCTDRLINNSRAPVERCVQKKRKRLDGRKSSVENKPWLVARSRNKLALGLADPPSGGGDCQKMIERRIILSRARYERQTNIGSAEPDERKGYSMKLGWPHYEITSLRLGCSEMMARYFWYFSVDPLDLRW